MAFARSRTNPDIPDTNLSLQGYTLFTKKSGDTQGGKVQAFYGETDIEAVAWNNIDPLNDSFFSLSWCKIWRVYFGVVPTTRNLTQDSSKKLNEKLFINEDKRL